MALETAAFDLGGRAPRVTHAPTTVEALSTLLRACDEAGDAVVLFGGGTLQTLGALPERYDVAIDLTGLNGIVEYEPRDFTVAVRAGTKLADLARTLRAERQFVPIDAPRPGAGTVGGALAAGWAGPRRRTYGAARDLVIGSTTVLADGTVAKAGGMVVKNVSGYDMSKLYVGSLGTLGALVRVNFKALPLPPVARAAIAPLPEHTRDRAIAHVRALRIEPTVAVVVQGFDDDVDGRDGQEGRLILLFEGSEETTERAIRETRSAFGAAGIPETVIVDRGAHDVLQRLIDAYIAPLQERSVTYRLFGLPDDVEARRTAIDDLVRRHGLRADTICDLRTGDLIVRVAANRAAFDACIVPFDDAFHDAHAARIIAAPGRLRGALDAWGAPPQALAMMREIKTHFDPRATLAPGRFVGGI